MPYGEDRPSYTKHNNKSSHGRDLGLEFLAEHPLQGVAILGKLFDTLVEFVKCHLVLKKSPAEFGLIINVGNFRDGVCLCSSLSVEPPRDRISAVP